jgi:hypothetical protein
MEDGSRLRGFAFRPLDGTVELALAEAASAPTLPRAVTNVLSNALLHVGNRTPATERVERLCVADRHFLLRELEIRLGRDHRWISHRCKMCGEPFDLELDLRALPIQEAGPSFPFADVDLSGTRYRFRLPTGSDQQYLVESGATEPEDDEEALALLAKICCVEESPLEQDALNPESLDAIDTALDAIAPALAMHLATRCPHCDGENIAELDPYALLRKNGEDILFDIHQIAYYYHWSEKDILALPRTRRQKYLALIDRARGFVH